MKPLRHLGDRLLGWVLALGLVLGLGLSDVRAGEAARGGGAGPGTPAPGPWYLRSMLGMEVGPTGAQFGGESVDYDYAARFDGREIVRRCAEAKSQYVVIWARDGEYAYYDSKVMPKAPGLRGRDVLREAVQAAKEIGMPVIAYGVVQYGSRALREHPEYRMVDAAGRPFDRVCFNTGYRDELKRLLTEMLAYGIDGFHLDMLDQGFGPPYGCWCTNCQALFAKQYGAPMPEGVTWDEGWDRMLEFRYDTSAQLEQELAAHVRSVKTNATVDFNYHGNPPFSWEVGQRPVEHAVNGDFVTGETGVWGFSALTVGLNAEFYRAATPGIPFQVAMQRGVRMYHDQTTRPLNDLRWELLTLLAHGAFVTVVDKTAYDGWLDPVAYERIGAAFSSALAKAEHFGQTPYAEVGIYFSSRTRDWYGREKPAQYFQSFQGAHKALVYEHIPWAVLLDENITPEALQRYPVVLLPCVAILSAKEISLLRRYVEAGGNLILTGWTGLLDDRGGPLTESVLVDLIGARFIRRLESVDNHFRFPANSPVAAPGAEPGAFGAPTNSAIDRLTRDIPRDWPFLVKGPAAVFIVSGATPLGELMKPHRTVRQREGKEHTDWPMSADASVGPAVLLNRVGKGQVLTFTGSPDFATASEHAVVEARKLLRNAVRLLCPEPVIEVTAPAHVEAVITDDPGNRRWRVHLLGYLSPPATTPASNRPYVLPSLIEDAPIYRASISVRRPLQKVNAWNRETEVKRNGQRVDLLVQDVHEIVLLDY